MTPKLEQRKAIHSIYRSRDVFVWLPNGFGKSLCYEVLPFVMDYKLSRIDCDTHRSQLHFAYSDPRLVYELAYI